MDDGIVGASKGVKDQSNVVMDGGIPIVQRNRPTDQVQSDIVTANLVRDDAKQMEAIDVVLIDREYFSVFALGFSKSPSLMMAQRRRQPVGNANLSLFSLHGDVP